MFEIGGSLREARLKRGLTPADVQKAIRIRDRYLQALEEERWEQLPGDAYVKGFLRTYADYLGLDGQLYVDEYNSRFVTGDEWGPRRGSVRDQANERDRRLQAGVVLIALAVVAVLTVVVISAWKASGSGNE